MAWGKKEADKQIDGVVKLLIGMADDSANKGTWRAYASSAIALNKAKRTKVDSIERMDTIQDAVGLIPSVEKKIYAGTITSAEKRLRDAVGNLYQDQADPEAFNAMDEAGDEEDPEALNARYESDDYDGD